MQQRNESEEGISVRDGANIAYFASHTLSLCWTVLTRQRFGSEAFGVPGVVAFLILLLTANCSQEWGMAILSGAGLEM